MVQDMLDLDELKPERIRGLKRVEYEQLAKLGAFDDEKVELLRGMVVTMSPQGLEHRSLVRWLTRRLIESLDRGYAVDPALPFAVSDDSEPEPDFLVSHATGEDFPEHPTTALLVIEISNNSLRKDRKVKMPIYAEGGVPEYWIFDVSNEDDFKVLVHTEPTPSGYAKVVALRTGTLKPLHLPLEISLADVPGFRH
jgi:Uma2 family endonuclease